MLPDVIQLPQVQMTCLTESEEWCILQKLSRLLKQMKTRYVADLQAPHDVAMLEAELRHTLYITGKTPPELAETQLQHCQEMLRDLCSLLESLAVSLPFTYNTPNTWNQGYSTYRRLRASIQSLESASGRVSLVTGDGEKLFELANSSSKELGQYLQTVTDCNDVISRHLTASPREPTISSISKHAGESAKWRTSRIRKRTKVVLGALFDHFRCGMTHDVLLRLSEDTGDDSEMHPSLQLMLHPCSGLTFLQEICCPSTVLCANSPSYHLLIDLSTLSTRG
ncbi:hypothetical protein CDD80_349 [Ophiocordyceps camponoti-rufipedis]|uniref:DUF7580 domain-containing protein n=1 Tax=Ophiocordyceps camponoti-rufipedis TaxID=2004952 RepID=A0A2C5XYB0_9HYPO|nr:hypothetical protein CDD80_349 [Ophiocordyceps camponoti-rufipedis]